MRTQSSFWLSLISLAISIITIVLFFVKVTNNSGVDAMTYLSVIGTFIGISVTLLIGYQIYNAVEIKNRLLKVQQLEVEISDSKSKLTDLSNLQEESIAIIDAKILQTKGDFCNAFIRFHSAIKYSIRLPFKREGYPLLLDELADYMRDINKASFDNCIALDQLNTEIELFKDVFEKDILLIKESSDYPIIKYRYEELMDKFYTRLNLIAQGKEVSPFTIDKLAKDDKYVRL
ncbi:MAG: hypothetical protein K2M88_06720 [Muribaculaceae bacterium]|nr:hypothetical protein [Muribaculaceae bacterium]